MPQDMSHLVFYRCRILKCSRSYEIKNAYEPTELETSSGNPARLTMSRRLIHHCRKYKTIRSTIKADKLTKIFN